MYRFEKENCLRNTGRRKVFIIAISTLVIMTLLVFSSIPGSPLFRVSGPFSFVADPIQQFVTGMIGKAGDLISSVREGEHIREENRELNNRITELEKRIKELEENGRRWEELKDAFHIKDIFSDYDLVGASVLTRDLGDWFDVFRVSAGTRDGIVTEGKNSYAVVDAKMNLVGRVYSSDLTSSRILPVLSESSVISAKLNTPGGTLLRVRGDVLLKEEGLCLTDNISDFSAIHVGDEIVTSGLGGLFPAGIPIGVITELDPDGVVPGKYAVLKVYTDYKLLKDVFIMKGRPAD